MKKRAQSPDEVRKALIHAPDAIETGPTRLQKAVESGKWGALAGGGLGLLRSALGKPDETGSRGYLRNTLAGALLGALGAGGTRYLATADPFTKEMGPAKGFETAKERAMVGLLTPGKEVGDVARESIFSGLLEAISGKHDFGPAEQKALVQQFTKAKVPTSHGWRRRVGLASKTVEQLQTDPHKALPSLVRLQKVAPDPEMKMLTAEAISRLRSGRAATPEGINAMATIAREMQGKLRLYRAATKTLDSLNLMKELYGAGRISEEDVAKNIGLVTGRFGSKSPGAVALRQLVQEALANEVPTTPQSPYPATRRGSKFNELIARAMQR
jgi:hypothetical protein